MSLKFAVIPALVALAFAQAPLPPSPQQPRPEFRTLTNFVEVDASVLDRQRKPIRGLKAANFIVSEDNVLQKVVTFSEIDVPEPLEAPTPWMRDVPPDVKTNILASDRRLVTLVLEDGIIGLDLHQQRIKAIARRIVDELGSGDLVSIIFTRDIKKSRDFTSDRAKLLAAIDTFATGYTVNGARNAVEALRKVAEFLADVPQRRKALIYVSSGWQVDFAAQGEAGAEAALLKLRLEEAFEKAQRSNVNIYCIDPTGLSMDIVKGAEGSNITAVNNALAAARGEAGPTMLDGMTLGGPRGLGQEFLQILASNTGGLAILNNNDFRPGVTQIFRENSQYYLLGYQSPNGTRDGKLRKINVEVDVPGATVRARNGYYGLKEAKAGAAAPSPVVTALSGILPASDLGMQVTVAPFAIPGKKEVALATVLAVRQPAPTGAESVTENVDVLMSAFDAMGARFGSQRMNGRLTLRPGATGRVQYEVLAQFDLKPGRYQLRFAASSTMEGKSGSIYYEVEVPDLSRNGLSLSGAVIATDPSVAAAPKDKFAALLPIVPTARRDFWPTDRVTAFVRLYEGGKAPIFPVQMNARVVDSHGDIVFVTKSTVAPSAFSAVRAADYRLALTMSDFKPGPHVLIIEAAGPDGKTQRRDIRFEMR